MSKENPWIREEKCEKCGKITENYGIPCVTTGPFECYPMFGTPTACSCKNVTTVKKAIKPRIRELKNERQNQKTIS